MVMSRKQQIVTALLAVVIVASVMSMPRTVDVPRGKAVPRVAGTVAAAVPTVTVELSHEQVKDLTYN